MSAAGGGWRLVKVGEGWWRPIRKNPPAAAAIPPTSTILHNPPRPFTTSFDIAHPPDPIARVVAHQQRSIRQHQKPDRSPPARPVSQLPPRDEVLDRDRPAVLHVHPHDLRARGYRAIPRAVIRHERI